MSQLRLDVALVARGLVSTRSKAAGLIREGAVTVDGVTVTKASHPVPAQAEVAVVHSGDVSRAARKLRHALDTWSIDCHGSRALDIGASTGGFTQVLLDQGADQVVALDVGHAQLVPSLRDDPRVVVREGVNARYLSDADLPWAPDLIVADLSFISLGLVLPAIAGVSSPGATVLVLVKPQFEVGRGNLDGRGVVTDPLLRERAVAAVIDAGRAEGLEHRGTTTSPLPGEAGNVEYFVWFSAPKAGKMGDMPGGAP